MNKKQHFEAHMPQILMDLCGTHGITVTHKHQKGGWGAQRRAKKSVAGRGGLSNAPVVTVVQTDNRERVVQISRRERINGEDALRAEVAAPRHFRWRDGPGGVVRGQVSQHFLVKFREIHVVFQQQGFRSHCNVRAIPYTQRKELQLSFRVGIKRLRIRESRTVAVSIPDLVFLIK
jgi:hypothetical protein